MRVCVCVCARARTTGLRGTQYGDVSTQGVAHASACTCMCECARMCACVYARAHARWLKTCSQRALNIRAISLSHRPSLSLSLTPPPSPSLPFSLDQTPRARGRGRRGRISMRDCFSSALGPPGGDGRQGQTSSTKADFFLLLLPLWEFAHACECFARGRGRRNARERLSRGRRLCAPLVGQ